MYNWVKTRGCFISLSLQSIKDRHRAHIKYQVLTLATKEYMDTYADDILLFAAN